MGDVNLSREELNVLLEKAADLGAKKALKELGLHDDEAGKDIRDLRELIDGWRGIKTTATRAIVKWFVMLVLGAIALGTYSTLHKG